jgi:hypothetical protein
MQLSSKPLLRPPELNQRVQIKTYHDCLKLEYKWKTGNQWVREWTHKQKEKTLSKTAIATVARSFIPTL